MVDFLRRSWAVVDLDCIDHNIRSIKEKLKPGCMIMGVVKADAYGHGDKYIADTKGIENTFNLIYLTVR